MHIIFGKCSIYSDNNWNYYVEYFNVLKIQIILIVVSNIRLVLTMNAPTILTRNIIKYIKKYSRIKNAGSMMTCVSRYSQVCHAIFRRVTLFSGVSRYSQACHAILRCVTLFSGVSRYSQVCYAIFRCVMLFSGMSRYSQVCHAILRCVMLHSLLRRNARHLRD